MTPEERRLRRIEKARLKHESSSLMDLRLPRDPVPVQVFRGGKLVHPKRHTYDERNRRDTRRIVGWLRKAIRASERVARRSKSIKSYALEDMLQKLAADYEGLPELLAGLPPPEAPRRPLPLANPYLIDWEERARERELLKSKRQIMDEQAKEEQHDKRPSVFKKGELESLFSEFEAMDKARLK